MTTDGPRYSKEEFERRGDALYENKIRPLLKPSDKGKFLAIDIESGEYELSRSEMRALDKLYARIPDAQPWMVRVGYKAVHSIGGGLQQDTR